MDGMVTVLFYLFFLISSRALRQTPRTGRQGVKENMQLYTQDSIRRRGGGGFPVWAADALMRVNVLSDHCHNS
jgi:hypothetical protein